MTSPNEITVTLPDGSQRSYAAGTTIKEVAHSIGKRLGEAAIGGFVKWRNKPSATRRRDGEATEHQKIIDVHTRLDDDCDLRIVTVNTDDGLEVLRHSTSHLMASAVQRLFPGTQVTFGPAVENGFYYDFFRPEGFTPDDLGTIEAEMKKIAQQNLPLERIEVSRDEARKLFEDKGEKFKREHVDTIPAGEVLTLYKHGDWVDLCEGPHVSSTKYLKAFKLTHLGGAYWRGDERNPQLVRIYGTAFWEEKQLTEHFTRLDEAKARDHRRIGKDLDLFIFDPLAPAMPFFMPKGGVLYSALIDFIRRYYRILGFREVVTPQIFDTELFHRSGHYAHYKENMFFSHIDEREFGLKPMNCPAHCVMFGSTKHSYRDLPLRLADFGRLHRYERSGVTAGLTRVRSFAQDDAHIFCREDQIGDEVAAQMALIQDVYKHFGFEMKVGLSTRPEASMGREPGLSDAERKEWDDIWANAEKRLADALADLKIPYGMNPGDGAFYGPKIDLQLRDAIGRWHQLGTLQLDYSMPRRFGLGYTNSEGGESRPVMIHRAVLGSLERFIGILTEHCAGDFPVWLAPTQVRVLTITDDLVPYGEEVASMLHDKGLRVGLDRRSEKLGFKIRDAELHKIPFVFVLGQKERDARAVAVRQRKQGDLGQMQLDRAVLHVLDAAALPTPGDELLRRADRRFTL